MKILNFGSCNIDHVYTMQHIVRQNETVNASALQFFPGGKGLNQSIALAKAGAQVYHAGCVGPDGDGLRALLRQNGVDDRYLLTVEEQTGHAVIQVDESGNNSIFIYQGANFCITRAHIDRTLADFGAGDVLVLQNEINNLAYLIDAAYQKQMKIFLNPSPFNAVITDLDLSKLYGILVNEIEAFDITGEKDPHSCLQKLGERYPALHVILTRGAEGSLLRTPASIKYCPAYRVHAVDTTAAGDTYTGFFIALSLSGDPLAMEKASAAAGIAASQYGAASSIPDLETVEQQLPMMIPYDTAKVSIQDITAYVRDHLDEITLPALAARYHYSERYVGKWIKRMTGVSFTQLVKRCRCEAAADYLRSTDLSIHDIVAKVGYENEGYLRKAFFEIYGQKMSEYRKIHKEM